MPVNNNCYVVNNNYYHLEVDKAEVGPSLLYDSII